MNYSKIFRALTLTSLLIPFTAHRALAVNYRAFTVAKGAHYSTGHLESFFEKQSMTFHGMFDDSAKYDPQDPSIRGINKFYGYTDCNSLVHNNSARFGWEWYQNQLLIYAYTYANSSTHDGQLMGAVPLNTDVLYKISNNGDHYDFEYTYQDSEQKTVDVKMSAPRGCSDNGGDFRFRLWPYFGGNATAPHDVTIYVDEI